MAFNVEHLEAILKIRENSVFSGYPISLKESEVREIIAELKEAREPVVMVRGVI